MVNRSKCPECSHPVVWHGTFNNEPACWNLRTEDDNEVCECTHNPKES